MGSKLVRPKLEKNKIRKMSAQDESSQPNTSTSRRSNRISQKREGQPEDQNVFKRFLPSEQLSTLTNEPNISTTTDTPPPQPSIVINESVAPGDQPSTPENNPVLPVIVANATENNSLPQEINKDRKKLIQILEMLECPVCLDYPRGGIIFTCSYGHIICNNCKPGVNGICPTCRNDNLQPSNFCSRIAEKALKDVLIKCKFMYYGCTREDKIEDICHHEERCQYRDVHCPAKHRGACDWVGSLSKMIIHVRNQSCIQILRNDNCEQPFKSFIGDYSQSDQTVFTRTVPTHWKPVLLVSRSFVKYLIYMTIQRTSEGVWYLMVRSFSPESMMNKIKIKLEIYGTTNSPIWKYEGVILSNKLSHSEALATGNYLMTNDVQMKKLKTADILFEYKVDVSVDIKDSMIILANHNDKDE